MQKKIGLFFGSFNPIHIGHMAIANYFDQFSDLDEVWMVVTPHNPLKKKHSLLDDYHRYQLVLEATHMSAIEHISMDILLKYAIDAPAADSAD